jgi:WD40 repeat protein
VIRAAAFTRDGRWMATGSSDGTARLWNMSGTPLAALDEQHGHIDLVGHIDEVRALAISEDSHWLLTGSEDGDARVWDLTLVDPKSESNVSQGPVGLVWMAGSRVLSGHTGPVWAVAISPDGQWMATGSQDGTARLWTHISLDDAKNLACRIAGRNLSKMEWDQYVREPEYYRNCSDFPSGQNEAADAPPAP